MPNERFMRHHYGASGYVNPKDRNPTAEDTLKEIEKILDDHTDYEGPMPGTGDYVGGVDPGALDLIVDLLRPKR